MKHLRLPTTIVLFGLLSVVLGPPSSALAQNPLVYTWQGTDAGGLASDWWSDTAPANWSFPQEPAGSFGETALINNNTTAVVSRAANPGVDGSELNPGGVTLGSAANMHGGLRIASGGVLNFVSGSFNDGTNLFVADGIVRVGTGAGRGTLTVERGGTLSALHLLSGGVNGTEVGTASALVLGGAGTGTATLTTGSADLQRVTRIIGPNVNFSATDTVGISGSYQPVINTINANPALAHSPIKTTGTANIGGTVRPEFDGVVPAVGNAWNLVDANRIINDFGSVDSSLAPALAADQAYTLRRATGGTNGQLVQLAVEQLLTLEVNRSSGVVSIKNAGATPVSMTSYTINSDLGALGGTWNSLQDQAQAGWVEVAPTANSLSELNNAANGNRTFAGGGAGAAVLGAAYVPAFPAFGTSPQDIEFQYTTANGPTANGITPLGKLTTGVVEYTGAEIFNNLVLTVDPMTGDLQLKNDSPTHTIALDGYSILSPSGALVTANFDGIDGLPGDTDANWDFANLSPNNLSELKHTDGGLTLAPNATRNLGNAFTVNGTQDLSLEFILFGENTDRNGAVVYGEAVAPCIPGDFNCGGGVENADLTLLLNNWGNAVPPTPAGWLGAAPTAPAIDNDELTLLLNNWGNVAGSGQVAGLAAVPEPSSAMLMLLGVVTLALRRVRGRMAMPAWLNFGSGLKMEKSIMESYANFAPARLAKVSLPLVCAVSLLCVLVASAPAANILYVGGQLAPDNDAKQLLQSYGHTISPLSGTFAAAPPTAEQLAGIDLIFVGRSTNSGDYSGTFGDPAVPEPATWNTIAKPLLLISNNVLRGSDTATTNRIWGWVNSTTGVNDQTAPLNFDAYPNAAHPFVAGRTTNVYTGGARIDYINTTAIPSGATAVATMTQGANTFAGIIDIPAGTTLFPDNQGTASVTGGRRVYMQMTDYPDTSDKFILSTNGYNLLDQIITAMSTDGLAVAGDVNGNGLVQANDFTPIQTNYGQDVTLRSAGDLNGDGTVDHVDFLQWKRAFTGGGGSVAGLDFSSIPEPSAALLLIIGIVGLASGRRTRRVG